MLKSTRKLAGVRARSGFCLTHFGTNAAGSRCAGNMLVDPCRIQDEHKTQCKQSITGSRSMPGHMKIFPVLKQPVQTIATKHHRRLRMVTQNDSHRGCKVTLCDITAMKESCPDHKAFYCSSAGYRHMSRLVCLIRTLTFHQDQSPHHLYSCELTVSLPLGIGKLNPCLQVGATRQLLRYRKVRLQHTLLVLI